MIVATIENLLLGTIAAPAGGTPDRLVAQAAITAAVGNRVWRKKAPQSPSDKPPYLIVRQAAGATITVIQGNTADAYATIDVLAVGTDADSTGILGDNVRNLLDAYATPIWQTGPRIKGMFLEDFSEDWNEDLFGGEIGRHLVPHRFKCWYVGA